VHCQTTYSRFNVNEGAARTPWLSGTASWAYYAATHWILGVRPETEGLRIDPCIPKSWPGFTMRRNFRGKTVRIEVKNPAGACRGIKSLTVDGRTVQGNVVPTDRIKDGTKIVATLG
jgi:cellobiose phosphorylase